MLGQTIGYKEILMNSKYNNFRIFILNYLYFS